MKVCIVTTAFPRSVGDGQGAFVWELARALTDNGIKVCVVAMHSPDARPRETIDGIEIARPRYWWPERWEMLRRGGSGGLPVAWRRYPWARPQLIPFMLVHTLVSARYAATCDLVHAQWTLSAAAANLGRWLHRRPVMVTVHGTDVFQASRFPLGAWFARSALRRCDRITALSRALAEATGTLGVPVEDILVTPYGVDVTRFTPIPESEREKTILYVGSFIERKGLSYLLGAMPEVLRCLPGYRLVLIGDGPQQAALEDLASSVGIRAQVEFLPFQPHGEVRRWMQIARLLVLPSTEEGMGVVLLEALACGTPVVASAVGGIPEVVDSQVGRLVPPGDVAALSRAMCEVLTDAQLWRRLSNGARGRAVTRYSWDRVARRFISLYEEVL